MKQKYLIAAVVVIAVLLAMAFVYSYIQSSSQNAAPAVTAPSAAVTTSAPQSGQPTYTSSVYTALLQEILRRDAPAGTAIDFTAYKIVGGTLSPSGDRTAIYFATRDATTKQFVNNGIFYVLNGRLGNSYLITKGDATHAIPEVKNIQWMDNSTMSYLLGDQVKTISVQ